MEKQLRNWFLTLFLCTESGVLYSLHLPCLSVGSQQESVYCVPMPALIWVPGTKNRLVVVCCREFLEAQIAIAACLGCTRDCITKMQM